MPKRAFLCTLFWIMAFTLLLALTKKMNNTRGSRMKVKYTKFIPDIDPTPNIIHSILPNKPFQFQRRKRARRRYIAAKRKGKLTKLGNKTAIKYIFLEAKTTSATRSTVKLKPGNLYKFDSDSKALGVDQHASKCMSNDKSDFISEITPVTNMRVKGAGGCLKVLGTGTLKWKIEDDDGNYHDIIIKEALYIPGLSSCLLCPQQWSKQVKDNFPRKRGTWCATYEDVCVLQWDQRKYTRTIKYDPSTNTPKLYTIPSNYSGMQCMQTICIKAKTDTLMHTEAFSTSYVCLPCENTDSPADATVENIADFLNKEAIPTPTQVDMDHETSALTPRGEYLRWHHRLGHLSFKKMTLLSILGILPRKLIKVRPPVCAACKYGAMTRRPTRVKGDKNKGQLHQAITAGECVSVDQMESRTPGFIGMMRGFITKQRYTCATIFVDHYSDLSYTHFQKSTNMEETLKALAAFEAFAHHHGVTIRHYHADNGRFADKEFLDTIANKRQTVSFCGVNAHFQNGRAEKRIRDLQDQARKVLLHSVARWPKSSSTHLWPYAMHYVNDVRNNIPTSENAQ